MQNILPPFDEFLILERETLEFIGSNFCKWRATSHIGNHVQISLSRLHDKKLAFDTFWDVKHEGRDCRVYIGGTAHSSSDGINRLSYYICFCQGRESNTCSILRKFHFDYTSINEDAKRKHPYFHLQYGGKLSPALAKWGLSTEHIAPLRPEISEPRLFFMPISLALAFNIVLHEFPTEETEKFRKDGSWRAIVRRNEESLLIPYYEKCLAGIRQPRKTLFDYAYVS